MFKRLLIANRGEIACRIIRTCRKMGMESVVVYSDADADSLAVEQADIAVPLGGSTAKDSYLRIDKILKACKDSGADAVHPGFGFLAENADLPRALHTASIAFIGPPAKAIAALGDKISAKKIAEKVKMPTVPGFVGVLHTPQDAINKAKDIGFPVILKAAAGGGGKGMRIVRTASEMADALRRAQSEAQNSFGDPRMFLERYIENPRHIEFQILADRHGNVIHLGERECSLQRRHQKVIEEAPSAFLDAPLRARMGALAVKLAEAAGYVSAGTCEFIMDARKNFYFLEMNTRLQVEHPVTEAITGLDLVEQMIRIAGGEKLPLTQKEADKRITKGGHAIEVRLCAEDPAQNFLPGIGLLTRCEFPETKEGRRIDTGISPGSRVTPYYDSMLAKIISHGPTRDAARRNLLSALNETDIAGVAHNTDFLAALLASPEFAAAKIDTGLIGRTYPEGFHGRPPDRNEADLLHAIAAWCEAQRQNFPPLPPGEDSKNPPLPPGEDSRNPPLPPGEGRGEGRSEGTYPPLPLRERAGVRGQNVILQNSAKPIPARVNGNTVTLGKNSFHMKSTWQPHAHIWRGLVNGAPVTARVETDHAGGWKISCSGAVLALRVLPAHLAPLLAALPAQSAAQEQKDVLAPMPGMVVSIACKIGESVSAGQELLRLEAMKMENIIKAPRGGVIQSLPITPGDNVQKGQKLAGF